MKALRMLAVSALLAALSAPLAQADTLKINDAVQNAVQIQYGSWNWVGGGSFDVSYLDTGSGDQALEYLYCVDLDHTITVPGTYASTVVTTNGSVNGSFVANADKVAWLLTQYGGVTGDNQTALQVAIWETIYDTTYDLTAGTFKLGGSNSAGVTAAITALHADIALKGGIGTGDVSQFWWISPGNSPTGEIQGLVTSKQGGSAVVPEGGSLALLLPGLAPLALALRKRGRRA